MNRSSIINNNGHLSVDKEVKLTLLLYEDYECENCGSAFVELKALREYFKENVCVVYRNFPCTYSHPSSLLAALVAEASGLQKKFIEVHDTILELQSYLEYGLGGILRIIEKKYAISIKQLMEDIENPHLKTKVNDDIECGVQMGVKKTPTIFINNNLYNGPVKFGALSKTVVSNLKINSVLQNGEQLKNNGEH
ncbi:MAG: thioredoxin domain-containing protein [Chitinophagaceae bacterium]